MTIPNVAILNEVNFQNKTCSFYTIYVSAVDDYKRTLNCKWPYTANIFMFKVNNRNTRKKTEICSKLTIKTPERRHRPRSGIFIANFEHISYFF